MSELIYHVAVTADGYIADPNDIADNSIFLYEGDHGPDFLSDIREYGIALMGGKTYEVGLKDGMKPGEPWPLAKFANPNLKHYIFSSKLDIESNEEVEFVKENAIEYINTLKQTANQKIWLCGGGELAGSLLHHELIDTLILKINPVMIGEGISLFGSSKKQIQLVLIDLKKYNNGVLLPKYRIIYK
ncbi:dihydrofolate reductase family protein [Cytobacillus horneckiae]|uniref:dihydrofolate reductase family protein n=1 Tax=Cytobacillus horneckiae TaxID=549687 RepID=UPI003D9A6BF7